MTSTSLSQADDSREANLERQVAEVVQGRRSAMAQTAAGSDEWAHGRDAVMRIPVSVRIVLGAAKMPLARLLALGRGSVIPLDRKVGELVDIVVNDRIVARGEVVVIDEDSSRFGVSIREIVSSSEGA